MAEKGQVIEIKDNFAIVRMTRTEACAKCRACIAGMKTQDMIVEAENRCNASVNDWVELEMMENGFINAVLIMYGIPFIALIFGIIIGYYGISQVLPFFNQDILSFISGLILTGISYMWIRSQEHRWSAKKYRPVAARIAVSK